MQGGGGLAAHTCIIIFNLYAIGSDLVYIFYGNWSGMILHVSVCDNRLYTTLYEYTVMITKLINDV